MRTVRRYALGVSLLVALTFSNAAIAAPAGRHENALTKIKNIVVRILEDLAIKGGLPPG